MRGFPVILAIVVVALAFFQDSLSFVTSVMEKVESEITLIAED